MLFKLYYYLDNNWLLDDTISFSLTTEKNDKISICIRLLDEKEKSIMKNKGYNGICEATLNASINKKIDSIFKKMENNDYQYLSPGDTLESYTSCEIQGIKYIIPNLNFFPNYFKDCVNRIKVLLTQTIKNSILSFRWVYNIEGKHNPLTSLNYFDWSRDNITWYAVPNGLYITASLINKIQPTESLNDYAIQEIKRGKTEPIYHTLFREAWQQKHQNISSSIVIGIASLEIAIKQCISINIEKAEWLMENIQSPPIHKILKNYFPLIFGKSIPGNLLRSIEKGVEIRNKVVHSGKTIPSIEEVDRVLNSIKNLLWIMDYFNGLDWTKNYMDDEVKNELFIHN